MPHTAIAQRYWDTNGRAAGASSGSTAPGTWGVDNFWSTSAAGTGNTGAWTAGQQAVFSAGGNATGTFTVGVSGNQLASGILFQEGTITLSGGTITLTTGVGNSTVRVASTNLVTIASQVAGTSGLIKDGTGTLLLSGTNSFSGVTSLQQGTLLVAKPSSLGASTLDLVGGIFGAFSGPVILNNAVTLSTDSTIGGSQDLTFTGNFGAEGGPRTLTIVNPAHTTFAGPTLTLGDPNRQGSLTLEVLGGDVLVSSVIQNGVGTRPDNLTKSGEGTLILTGNNTFSGPLHLDAGALVLGNNAAAGSGTLILGDNVTLAATNGPRTIANSITLNGDVTFAGPDSFTFLDSFNLNGDRTFTVLNTTLFNGVISGRGYTLTKEGYGTLVLNGANTFGGSSDSLSINNGTVALGNNSAAGRSGTTLLLNGGSVTAYGAARTIANPFVIARDSAIGGDQNLTFSGTALNNGGTNTLTVNNTALTTFAGSTFTLSSSGTDGQLNLDVAGSSGGLIINNRIQNSAATSPDSLVKSGAGILTLGGTAANTFSGGLTLNNGTLNAAKVNALGSGPLTLNNGTLNIGAYNQTVGALTMTKGTLTGSSGLFNGSSYLVQAGTISAMLTGSGALTKTSPGTLTLTRSNSFTGGLNLNAGSLVLGDDRAAGSGTLAFGNNVTLSGSGGPRTITNNLSFAGNVTFGGSENLNFTDAFDLTGNRTLTVQNNTTFSGAISGTGYALSKDGAGTLTLAGTSPNTFSGGLTLNNGTLNAAKVNALGSGPLTLNNGTLNLATYNQTVASLTLRAGTINGTSGSLNASSFQVQSGTINASLSGTGALTKSTAGSVMLTGNNTYSGGSTLDAGSLWVNNASGSGTGSGSVTVNNGATLGGTGAILGQVLLNSGACLAPGYNGVGRLNLANLTARGGATLQIDIDDALAGPGVGWDLLNLSGSLTLHASAANPIFVDVHSLTLANLDGPVFNFTNSQPFAWRILSANGGISFDPGQTEDSAFSLLLTHFQNNIGTGTFSFDLANGNRDLILTFTPTEVPEPKAWAMIALGFVLFFARRKYSVSAK